MTLRPAAPRSEPLSPPDTAVLRSLDADEPAAEGPNPGNALIGAVVKAERTRRGWSIAETATRTELSKGMISQIERGLSTPSLRTLRLLAGVLEIPITRFFDDAPPAEPPASPYVMKRAARRSLQLATTGINKMYLMPPGAGSMEMWEFNVAPGGTSGGELYVFPGEKAGVVMEGQLRLWLDDEAIILEEGDSFRFSSMLRHKLDNPFAVPARLIWIVTPPIPVRPESA